MATQPSILAWKIPWIEDSGRLQSMVLQRDMTEQLTVSLSRTGKMYTRKGKFREDGGWDENSLCGFNS